MLLDVFLTEAFSTCPLRSRWLVALVLTIALLDCLALAKDAERPPQSGLQAFIKRVAGLPPQLVFDQCGVD